MVVADLPVHARMRRAERLEEAIGPHPFTPLAMDPSATGVQNDLGAVGHENIDYTVGDLGEGLIPTHPLPAPLAALAHALERIFDPSGIVHPLGITNTLLTAARIGVRHGRVVRRRVVADLLLPQDDAILDIEVEITGALVPTVGWVGGFYDFVPSPRSAADLV